MNIHSKRSLLSVVGCATMLLTTLASAQNSPGPAGRDEAVVATLHAAGAQIYDCKPDSGTSQPDVHALTWQFREPIATLVVNGKTIGRHFAGPSWEHIDGSATKGKIVATLPGASSNDIAWLEIELVEHRGDGILSAATTVRRINTKGGVMHGSCERAGDYLSVPYSADYVFLRKGM